MKRVILNLDDEVAERADKERKRLGLPSRNSFIEQCIRARVGMDSVFDKEEGP